MNTLEIVGEIGWDVTASEIKNQLEEMSGDLTVEISSVGGSVYQGIEIFNALSEYKGHITTINKSMAASMASYIMLVGDTVKAYDNATYGIHNPLIFTKGNHNDLYKTASHLKSLSRLMAKKYVEKTGKELSEVTQMMDDETFLYGNEVIDHGFVDEMISTDKNLPKESAVANIVAEYTSCLASSKEHCKIEGYNTSIENILAAMPTESKTDKIAQINYGGDGMTITKEEFDAVQAKYDALEATNNKTIENLTTANAKLAEFEATIEGLKSELELAKTKTNTADIVAFSGANRDAISLSKEAEFIKNGASLQEVMTFVRDNMEEEASQDLDSQEEKAKNTVIGSAIAKYNKGK